MFNTALIIHRVCIKFKHPVETCLFSEITEVTVKHIMEQVQLYQRHTTHIHIKRCLLSNSDKESH